MSELKDITLQRMQKFFPKALEMALASYRRVSHRTEHDYPDFKKQQEACKVSIAHIQLLLKLGNELVHDCKTEDKGAMDQGDLRELIENAQEEIKNI